MSTDQAQRNKEVRSEQLRMLYEQAPGALAGQLILVSFIGYVVHFELPLGEVGVWALVMTGIAVADFLGYVGYRLAGDAGEHYTRWHRLFSVSVVIVALSWGLAFLYLMTRVGTNYQLFLALMLACFGGGSVAALAPRSGLLAYNLVFSLAPPILWLLFHSTMLGMAAAFALTALGAELWFGGRRIGERILESLELRFEKEALARELECANSSLREMSHTDSLTGLRNRRFFDEALNSEWGRVNRGTSDELGLILIDVDHFKPYNDRLGHQAGDDCLRRVARAISEAVNRPGDVTARFGGEEFVVLLPETGLAGCRAVARRIRHALEVEAMPHPGSGVADILTVSMGVCALGPADADDPGELISRADEALYRAKEKGRDRIEVVDPRD